MTLHQIQKTKAIRKLLLGREFTYGLVIGVIVEVKSIHECTFVPLRWVRPNLFRWRRVIPRHLSPTGWVPERTAVRQRGNPPLPYHTPMRYGTHLFLPIGQKRSKNRQTKIPT